MHKQKLIDDTFQVTEIDKGGKVFDKGTLALFNSSDF